MLNNPPGTAAYWPLAVFHDGSAYLRARVGQTVAGYEIEGIRRGEVLLLSGGHRSRLRLVEGPRAGGSRTGSTRRAAPAEPEPEPAPEPATIEESPNEPGPFDSGSTDLPFGNER